MNHGTESPQVLQEYPVSMVLCNRIYRLVEEFGITGSAQKEGAKKKRKKKKKRGKKGKKIMFLLNRN
jgi:hypothetical protein